MHLSKTAFSLKLTERFKQNGRVRPQPDFQGASSEGQHTHSPDRALRAFRNQELAFLSSREASQDPDAVVLSGGITVLPGEEGDKIFIHSENETCGQSEMHFLPNSRKKTNRFPEIHKVIRLTENQLDSLQVWVRKDGQLQVEEQHIDRENPDQANFSLWLLTR
jgi:hypothetical protein